MVKKVFAIIALVAFVAVMIDVFFIQYALEIVLPIYIIAMLAGVIVVIFTNTAAATRKVSEARNADADTEEPEGADGAADAD